MTRFFVPAEKEPTIVVRIQESLAHQRAYTFQRVPLAIRWRYALEHEFVAASAGELDDEFVPTSGIEGWRTFRTAGSEQQHKLVGLGSVQRDNLLGPSFSALQPALDLVQLPGHAVGLCNLEEVAQELPVERKVVDLKRLAASIRDRELQRKRLERANGLRMCVKRKQ